MVCEKYSENIERLLSIHNDLTKGCVEAYKGTLYPVDLLALSVINRSYNLIEGFCDLIVKKNIIAAAPLIRMQLDNVLRFSAIFYVSNPHDFALKVLNGIHINKLKSIENKPMTDKYLVQKLVDTEQKEWIEKVYNNTSGYVHFSEKHIYSTFKANNNNGELTAFIGSIGNNVENSLVIECIECFIECTEILIKYIEGWIYTKNNPEIVQELKKEIINRTGKEPKEIYFE